MLAPVSRRFLLLLLGLSLTALLLVLIFRPGFRETEPAGDLADQMEDAAQNSWPKSGTHQFLPNMLHAEDRSRAVEWQTSGNLPIWPHASLPTAPEVALFRHEFALDNAADVLELHIFADTRYEVWIDGEWIGRGPARFSRKVHEFDYYPLNLAPGHHRIAVLVQWAPNIRRSESSVPMLRAYIQAIKQGVREIIAPTGPEWQAMVVPAWRADAVQVHRDGLLGPTELLDLRQLPRNWHLGNGEAAWAQVEVTKEAEGVIYRARSIPLLANVPFTMTVIDAGALSPGRIIGHLIPSEPSALTLPFTVSAAVSLTVEMLSEVESGVPAPLLIDGHEVRWQEASPLRPGVQEASVQVGAGEHSLTFATIPPVGLPFAVSSEGIEWGPLPFAQGNHAGRRLLLAEPVRQEGRVRVHPDSASSVIDLVFDELPAYVVLDLGRVVHGRLTAEVVGPAGTILDIGWDERLFPGTLRPLPHPGALHPQWNQTDSWILDGTRRSASTLDTRAGRYILIAAWGKGPVSLRNLHVYEERYPVVQKGWFHSSNPRLDQIWQLGVNTALPSMQDAYADVWRERGQWWGDAYVVDHINRVTFGDDLLLRRGLQFMADAMVDGRMPGLAPNPDGSYPLDYGMLWVQSAQDYLERRSDSEVAAQVYPAVQAFLAHLASLQNRETGLIELPPGHWSQTAVIDWSGSTSRSGQSTVLNSLYVETLRDAAAVATLLGNTREAEEWQATAESVKNAIHQFLYLPEQNQYAVSILAGELITPTTHAQAWPLAFGIVPPDQVEAVTRSMVKTFHLQPFGMFWGLEALAKAGHIEDAVELILLKYGHYLDRGATTLWEHWDSELRYEAALSHGWGGAPTWFLSTYVMGARRIGPNQWRVQPAFAGVEHVSGAIPLGDETLAVSWERQRDVRNTMNVDAPPGSSGEIVVSLDGAASVRLNGQAVWDGVARTAQAYVDGDLLYIRVPGGSYSLVVELD